MSRLDDTLHRIRNMNYSNDSRIKRNDELLETIAITNAMIQDQLDELITLLKEQKNE